MVSVWVDEDDLQNFQDGVVIQQLSEQTKQGRESEVR